MNSLREMRESLLKNEDAPENTGPRKSSLIRRRAAEEPVKEKDPLEFSRNWLGTIKRNAEMFRQKSEQKMAEVNAPEEPEAKRERPLPPITKDEGGASDKRSLFDEASSSSSSSSRSRGSSPAGSLEAMIDHTEGAGAYDTLYGHSQKSGAFAGTDITKMTIGELKQFASRSGPYGTWMQGQVGRLATPMGRYQFVGQTMGRVAEQMGLSDDTLFSASTQDTMYEFHKKNVLKRGNNPQEKVAALRREWEGLKNVPTADLVAYVRRVS